MKVVCPAFFGVGDGIWDVYYSHVQLGQMDERILKVEDALGKRMRIQ